MAPDSFSDWGEDIHFDTSSSSSTPKKPPTPGLYAADDEMIKAKDGRMFRGQFEVSHRSEFHPSITIANTQKGLIGHSVSTGIQYIKGPRGLWVKLETKEGQLLYDKYVKTEKQKEMSFKLKQRVELRKISPEGEIKTINHLLEACRLNLVKPGKI